MVPKKYWVRRVHCHKPAKGNTWKGVSLCGLISQILLYLGCLLLCWWLLRATVMSCGAGGCCGAMGLVTAVSLLKVASVGCAGSLFWCVNVWITLWERFFKDALKIIINCPFENMSISYLPITLLTNSLIWAFWKLAQPHLLWVIREDLSLLSTQQLKNSREWQLPGQQQ